MPEEQPVTLENLLGGAALDLVNERLDEVWADLRDPSKNKHAPRKVTLTLTMTRSKQFDNDIIVQIDCPNPKLASAHPVMTKVGLGVDSAGKAVAVEYPNNQESIYDHLGPKGENVTPIGKRNTEIS